MNTVKNMAAFACIGKYCYKLSGRSICCSLVFWALFMTSASAQVYTERVICIADRPFYLTGESIHFSLFVFGQSPEAPTSFSSVSKIAYVELMDSIDNVAMQTSLLLSEGSGMGELFLPHRLRSGNYYLRVYTRWMRNFGTGTYAYVPLTLVNPFRNLGLQKSQDPDKRLISHQKSAFFKENHASISGLETSYGRRAAVKVQIDTKLSDKNSRWVLSVSRYEPLMAALSHPLGIVTEDFPSAQKFAPQFLPEMQGMLVTTRARYAETGSSADNSLLYLSSPGKSPLFFTGRSNQHGYVHFETNHLYGNRKWILQTNAAETISMEPLQIFCNQRSSFNPGSFAIDSAWTDLIVEYSRNMQVNNAYAAHTRINQAFDPSDSLPFYGTPDHQYMLDDYTRFPVMEEVLREYVPSVVVRKRRDEFYFRLTDYVDKGFFRGDPLMLVDGVPVSKANQIMDINPLRIRRIDVVNKRYFLGNADFNGILALWSYEGDMAGVKLDASALYIEVPGNQPPPVYSWPDYTVSEENSVPDLRNTLYWKSGSWANITETVEFFTGDQMGRYRLCLWNIREDGSIHYMDDFFEVR
jgi:hypothetical protein